MGAPSPLTVAAVALLLLCLNARAVKESTGASRAGLRQRGQAARQPAMAARRLLSSGRVVR